MCFSRYKWHTVEFSHVNCMLANGSNDITTNHHHDSHDMNIPPLPKKFPPVSLQSILSPHICFLSLQCAFSRISYKPGSTLSFVSGLSLCWSHVDVICRVPTCFNVEGTQAMLLVHLSVWRLVALLHHSQKRVLLQGSRTCLFPRIYLLSWLLFALSIS